MDNRSEQQTGFSTSEATTGGFQSTFNPANGQPQFFFAGGVPAPSSGIYSLTPAPPGGLSSVGPKWPGYSQQTMTTPNQ